MPWQGRPVQVLQLQLLGDSILSVRIQRWLHVENRTRTTLHPKRSLAVEQTYQGANASKHALNVAASCLQGSTVQRSHAGCCLTAATMQSSCGSPPPTMMTSSAPIFTAALPMWEP